MAEFETDRILATAKLMDLAGKLRGLGGYKIKSEYPDGNGGVVFEISHGISWWSWGEKIKLNMVPYNDFQTAIFITSECLMPIQVVDCGRNQKNIDEIRGVSPYGNNESANIMRY